MKEIISIIQIVISVILIMLVLFEQRGAALGSAFGGEGEGFYSTRRGIQKKIFWGIVIFGALFIILSLINLAF